MFSRFNRKLIDLTLLALMLAVSGCIYIPPLSRQFTEKKRAEIVVGKTTKDRVIKLLGEPNILKDRRFFIYKTQRSYGTIWFFFGGGYSGTIFPVPIKEQHFLLLLRFDDQNIVKRYEVETTKMRLFEGAISENLEKSANRLNGELLLKIKGKDLLGFETRIAFYSVAISPDGRIMGAGGLFWSKKIWMKNLVTGELRVIDTPAYDEAVFSPDLTRVALLKRTVTILDTKTGKILLIYRGHGDSSFWSLHGALCLAFDQTGRFVASGGYQGDIRIWDCRTGKDRLSFKGHDKRILSIAWSHDDRLLATSGLDGFVKVWKAATGEVVFRRKQEIKEPGMLSFSPDGNVLAINTGSHTELWRIKYNSNHDEQVPRMNLYNASLLPYFNTISYELSLAWSPDGRALAVGNGSEVVYHIEKGERVFRLIPHGLFLHPTDHNTVAHTLIFSPDGKSIVTGTNEGIYRYHLLVSHQ